MIGWIQNGWFPKIDHFMIAVGWWWQYGGGGGRCHLHRVHRNRGGPGMLGWWFRVRRQRRRFHFGQQRIRYQGDSRCGGRLFALTAVAVGCCSGISCSCRIGQSPHSRYTLIVFQRFQILIGSGSWFAQSMFHIVIVVGVVGIVVVVGSSGSSVLLLLHAVVVAWTSSPFLFLIHYTVHHGHGQHGMFHLFIIIMIVVAHCGDHLEIVVVVVVGGIVTRFNRSNFFIVIIFPDTTSTTASVERMLLLIPATITVATGLRRWLLLFQMTHQIFFGLDQDGIFLHHQIQIIVIIVGKVDHGKDRCRCRGGIDNIRSGCCCHRGRIRMIDSRARRNARNVHNCCDYRDTTTTSSSSTTLYQILHHHAGSSSCCSSSSIIRHVCCWLLVGCWFALFYCCGCCGSWKEQCMIGGWADCTTSNARLQNPSVKHAFWEYF